MANLACMPLPIEDYAVIGDGSSVALVGRDGSVDWLCLPRFDSPACFAALLGDERHGRWLIGPARDHSSERRYVGDSGVLETTYTTDTGVVEITDLMPVYDDRHDVVRRIRGVSGSVRIVHEWAVRLGYGKIRPWVHREEHEGAELIVAVAGPDKIVLRGPRLPVAEEGFHTDEFDVAAGEELTFSTTWVHSYRQIPRLLAFEDRISSTIELEQAWADACQYDGPWRPQVVRSLITLRALTHSETGGIVAAPTTSLPEDFGGERNWDYRYCWLRDAALTIEALLAAKRSDEARLWRDWLLRAVAGDPEDLQIMYTVDGGRFMPEMELTHLPGYAESRPVRIGNGAAGQRQGDVLGEVLQALDLAREAGLEESNDTWSLQRTLVNELARSWTRPDHGLWEIRGPQRHFTHSRVMAWVAFDRAVRAVERHGLEGPEDEWRAVRDRVREEVLEQGLRPGSGNVHPALRHHRGGRSAVDDPSGRLPAGRRSPRPRDDRGDRGGPAARRAAAPLPNRDRRRWADGRRERVHRLLVLAGLGVRPCRPHGRREGADGAASLADQRRRPAQRGVRRAWCPDGGQLPPGVLAPGPGRRGDDAPGGTLPEHDPHGRAVGSST